MRNCERCKFLSSDLHGAGICDFFGDDIPLWADNYNDGCLLKSQEITKVINLSQDIRYFDFEKREADGTPIWSENDKKRFEEISKKYDKYISILQKRCLLRRNK